MAIRMPTFQIFINKRKRSGNNYKFVKEAGFDAKEISAGVIDYTRQEFRNKDNALVDEKYSLVGSIDIETDKVDLVSQVRAQVNKLIAKGLDLKTALLFIHEIERN